MQIADIARLPRTGSLLGHSHDLPNTLTALSQGILPGPDGPEFKASSATAAIAWLLQLAHYNATGLSVGQDVSQPKPLPFKANRLIGFRGQNARYQSITPRLFRKSHSERRLHSEAFTWFHAAISAWHNSRFFYMNGHLDAGGVDLDAALGVAQHYGIDTLLVDWSWDPIDAMAFAISELSEGDSGAVYICDFGSGEDPASEYNVLLPPTFAHRIWKQRGFFDWHTVPPEHWSDPVVQSLGGGMPARKADTRNYCRIIFTVTAKDIEWATDRLAYLYKADESFSFTDLINWSLHRASCGDKIGWHQVHVMQATDFTLICKSLGIDLPTLFVETQSDAFERDNISQSMDYIDFVALRKHQNNDRLTYYIPALLTVTCGMPWSSFPNRPTPEAGKLDARAAIFYSDKGRSVDEWSERLRHLKAVREEYKIDFLELLSVPMPYPQNTYDARS